jgi:hypothetical protein
MGKAFLHMAWNSLKIFNFEIADFDLSCVAVTKKQSLENPFIFWLIVIAIGWYNLPM